ncbi:alanine racemase [Sessilibacter corallicola]|uniref:Alanine racemase n=1 Tax=Sessilibacter corallicola TaxID=2904075 RepID=A0ABQ0AAK7_9GAMM
MTPELTINLDALVSNWRTINSLSKTAVAGAVVKANAYGLGLKEVSLALFNAGCKSFFVATLDEAVEFRKFLDADADIFVFSGCHPGESETFERLNITPVLNSLFQIDHWAKRENNKPCALMLDTGMNRLGLSKDDLDVFLSGDYHRLNLQYVLSHLACADEPEHAQSPLQLTKFQNALSLIKTEFPDVVASLSNSAGALLDGKYHFDLMRPGVVLYGGFPDPKVKVGNLQNVVELSLPIIQVRKLTEDQSVGYGASEVALKGTYLATVRVGYADGIFRCAQGKLTGMLKGELVPLVGRVSMDYCVFDITGLVNKGLSVRELESGGKVQLINSEQTINDLALMENTISYEVLTSLGNRYKKTYRGSCYE